MGALIDKYRQQQSQAPAQAPQKQQVSPFRMFQPAPQLPAQPQAQQNQPHPIQRLRNDLDRLDNPSRTDTGRKRSTLKKVMDFAAAPQAFTVPIQQNALQSIRDIKDGKIKEAIFRATNPIGVTNPGAAANNQKLQYKGSVLQQALENANKARTGQPYADQAAVNASLYNVQPNSGAPIKSVKEAKGLDRVIKQAVLLNPALAIPAALTKAGREQIKQEITSPGGTIAGSIATDPLTYINPLKDIIKPVAKQVKEGALAAGVNPDLGNEIANNALVSNVRNKLNTAPGIKQLKQHWNDYRFAKNKDITQSVLQSDDLFNSLDDAGKADVGALIANKKQLTDLSPEVQPVASAIRLKFYDAAKKLMEADPELAKTFETAGKNMGTIKSYTINKSLADDFVTQIANSLSPDNADALTTVIGDKAKYVKGDTIDDFAVKVRNALVQGKYARDINTADALIGTTISDFSQVAAEQGLKAVDKPAYFGPLLYMNTETAKAGGKAAADATQLDRFKPREIQSPEKIAALGGQVPSQYSVAKGLSQELSKADSLNYYKKIADTVGSAEPVADYYVQVPKGFGDLSGKYVPRTVLDHVQNLQTAAKAPKSSGGLALNWALKRWKEGKTILNPAQQARNVMSNFILNAMVDPGSTAAFPSAVKSMFTRDKWYKEFKENGGLGRDYSTQEIQRIQKLVDPLDNAKDLSAMELVKNPSELGKAVGASAKRFFGTTADENAWTESVSNMGNLQGFMEDSAKLQQYIFQRQYRGLGVQEALQKAVDATFDYSDVTPFEAQTLRKIIPFYTFARKSVPLIVKTALEHPQRILAYDKAMRAVEGSSKAPDETNLPDYMIDMTRLPSDGQQYRYFNMKYILPWGGLLDEQNTLPLGIGLNPFATELAQLGFNKDLYFNQEIRTPGAPASVQAGQVLTHARRQLSPAVLNVALDKLPPALRGGEDYLGRKRTVGDIIKGDVFGFKTYPFDEAKAAQSKQYLINTKLNDYRSQIKKTQKDVKAGKISQKEADRRISVLQEYIRKIKTGEYQP